MSKKKMSKYQLRRYILLIAFPFIILLTLFGFLSNAACSYAAHPSKGPCYAGFPLRWGQIFENRHADEYGYTNPKVTNYLFLTLDIIFWMIPIASWVYLFRFYGKKLSQLPKTKS